MKKVISKFTIDTKTYNMSIVKMLNLFKYKKREKDWIKQDEQGRYHAIQIGREINVHYDVNTVDGRHMTLPSVNKLQKEKKKMLYYLYNQEKKYETHKPYRII